MPALRCLIFAMAVTFASSGPMAAACQALAQAVDLTERNFAPGQAADPGELAQLNSLISGISNDALLSVLRSGGQANAFGNLRNFLTQVKFISASTEPDLFRFTPQMQDDLSSARKLVDAVCTANMQKSEQPSLVKSEPGQTNENVPAALRDWLNRNRIFGPERADPQADGQLHMLVPLVLLVLIAAALVIAGRYAVQFLLLTQRKRRLCSIPADLVCMMTTVPGHVTVLELAGCTFIPTPGRAAEEMRDVSAGTYCAIWMDGVELQARLTSKISEDVDMDFTEPLASHALGALLDQSETPVRFDFSALRDGKPSTSAA